MSRCVGWPVGKKSQYFLTEKIALYGAMNLTNLPVDRLEALPEMESFIDELLK